jgi:predicted RNase H-like nuclease
VDRLFAGIDLAWSATGAGRTGLAVVGDSGALQASTTLRTDDEIARWLGSVPGRLAVAAVDAPLVVPNETGQRPAETAIARAYGAFKIGAHTCNRSRAWMDPPRAEVLAKRLGWQVAPTHRGSPDFPACIEVYPHPAMVALFGLEARLTYKGRYPFEVRREAFTALLGHLEAIESLALADSADWARLRAGVASAGRQSALDAVEDELDAVLCAHVAWLWHHRPDALQVYPSLQRWEEGYIVAPPAPVVGRRGRLTVDVELAEYDAVRAAIAAIPGVRSVR